MPNRSVIDIFDVALPCQSFMVTASVSSRTKLELAEEYALTLIHTLGAATQQDFQNFFGFPPDETLDLIAWLIRNEYLATRDGILVLAAKGENAFHESEDGSPILVKPAEVAQRIALERLSFTPVSQFAAPVPATVPELPAPELDGNVRQIVSAAVERHYGEWSKEWKHKSDLPADMLYGIHAVTPQDAFLSRESIPLVLSIQNGQIEHELDVGEIHRRGRLHSRDELIAAVRQYIQNSSFPSDAHDAAKFAATFDNGTLSSYARLGRFDIKRWVCDPRKSTKGAWTFVGSPIADEAFDLLTRFTEPEAPSAPQDKQSPIIWLAPQHRFWGASARYAELLARMGSLAANRGGVIVISRQREQRPTMRRAAQKDLLRFPKATSSVVWADPSAFPQALEVIIDPGRWVLAVIYQRYGPEDLPIGAGFCSLEPTLIRKALRAIAHRLLKQPYVVSTLIDNAPALDKPTAEMQRLITSWSQ